MVGVAEAKARGPFLHAAHSSSALASACLQERAHGNEAVAAVTRRLRAVSLLCLPGNTV